MYKLLSFWCVAIQLTCCAQRPSVVIRNCTRSFFSETRGVPQAVDSSVMICRKGLLEPYQLWKLESGEWRCIVEAIDVGIVDTVITVSTDIIFVSLYVPQPDNYNQLRYERRSYLFVRCGRYWLESAYAWKKYTHPRVRFVIASKI